MHLPAASQAGVQLVKRFTGGGTVIVDQDTLFCTLIMQSDLLPHVDPFPQSIMRWTEGLYTPVFAPHGPFSLRENDYVFRERKFGGNAQAITRGRWLHHTSFLWDFDPGNMALLKHPPKAPEYRSDREHLDFLLRLKDVIPQREFVLATIASAARQQGFEVQEATLQEAQQHLEQPHLRGNKLLTQGDSDAAVSVEA